MKPRTMLLVILAIVTTSGILVTIAFHAFGLKGGTVSTLLGVALFAAASAVPLHFVAVRPSSRHLEKLRALSLKAEAQDLLIMLDTMAMEAAEPDLMLRRAAEDVRRLLDGNRCTLWLFGPSETVAESRAEGLPPADTDFPLRRSREMWKDLCQSGKCAVVEDVRRSAVLRSVADAMDRFGARAFIKAPLGLPGGPIGFLFLGWAEPHEWNDDFARVVRAVARQIGTAIGHARDIRGREAVTGNLLSLLDHVPGLVYRGQRDWTMTIVSADIQRMTGYSQKEFLDGTVNWKSLVHPDDLPSLKLTFRDAVARKHKVLRVEYRARHRNGNYRWFADRRQIIYDQQGRYLYADGICLDITERKRVEGERAAQTPSAEVHAVT